MHFRVPLKSIFELVENLSLVLTKLDTELGLAQPQLVVIFFKQAHRHNNCRPVV